MRTVYPATLFVGLFIATSPGAESTDMSNARESVLSTSNRIEAIVALANMGGSDTNAFATNCAYIVKAIHNTDRGVRRAAALALARSAPHSIPTIRTLFSDQDPRVREEAAEAVIIMARSDRVTPLALATELARTLDDPFWAVRREAAIAIQRIGVLERSLNARAKKVIESDGDPACTRTSESDTANPTP